MNELPPREFDVSAAAQNGLLIYWRRQGEQWLEVREDQHFRWLLLDGVVQSVLQHAAASELCLPHQRLLQALLPAEAQQILHLGLGGGDLLRWLHHRYPGVQQTAVDLNAAVIDIYQQFFQQQEQPTLCCHDAFAWLKTDPMQYDLILIDLFSDDGSPAPLFQPETYQYLQQRLTPLGKVIVNLLPRTEQEWQQVRHLLACCGQAHSLQIAHYRNHLIWTEPKPAARTSPAHH
ncbi:fused MFS/spermidine synthase [Tolumonas lignilytica]|uniref:fused MFS/spermidine synthase n=1 Tax=Tolumonas lignilytica TaxID=1283284 RepID=UPI0004645B0D|nr:fused MFS/spermidine synthase [Tolumonas lignilytica]